jgi:uncharacterized membrane protein YedE/YeeE
MTRFQTVPAVLGVLFGFTFAGAELNQYDTIHDMLSLRNISPYLIMASAIATAAPLLWLLERRNSASLLGGPISLRRWAPNREMATGGVIFGVGWAVTGACPGTASTSLGTGSLMGLVLIAGILAGIRLRDVHVRTMESVASSAGMAEPVSG